MGKMMKHLAEELENIINEVQVVAKIFKGYRLVIDGQEYTVTGSQKIRKQQWYILRDKQNKKSSIRREAIIDGQKDGTVVVKGPEESRQQSKTETWGIIRKADDEALKKFGPIHDKLIDQIENILEDYKDMLDDAGADRAMMKSIDDDYVDLMRSFEDGFNDIITKHSKKLWPKR